MLGAGSSPDGRGNWFVLPDSNGHPSGLIQSDFPKYRHKRWSSGVLHSGTNTGSRSPTERQSLFTRRKTGIERVRRGFWSWREARGRFSGCAERRGAVIGATTAEALQDVHGATGTTASPSKGLDDEASVARDTVTRLTAARKSPLRRKWRGAMDGETTASRIAMNFRDNYMLDVFRRWTLILGNRGVR